jgi:hypothetical protein
MMRTIMTVAALVLSLVVPAHAQQYWPSYQYDIPPPLRWRSPLPYPDDKPPRRFGPQDVRRVHFKAPTVACKNKLILRDIISANDKGFETKADLQNALQYIKQHCAEINAAELHGSDGSLCVGYALDEAVYGETMWFQCSRIK